MLQRKKLSVSAQKRTFPILLGLVIKSLHILGKDKVSCKNDIWSSLSHYLVTPHDSKCQTKSLFLSHETTSVIKVPETNCISVHENPLFLLINLLYLKAELEFLSYWEKKHREAHSYCHCCESHKKGQWLPQLYCSSRKQCFWSCIYLAITRNETLCSERKQDWCNEWQNGSEANVLI